MRGSLAAANAKIVFRQGYVSHGARTGVAVYQRAVDVSLNHAGIVSHRDMSPLIQRRHITGIDPIPARIGVSKGTLDGAILKTCDLILALLVDDSAAVGGQ